MKRALVSVFSFSLFAALLVGCAARVERAPIEAPAIVRAADWGSAPREIPASRRHELSVLTLHHAGVVWKDGDDPVAKIRGLQKWGQSEKGWPDVPYHFLVAPDGRIFEGRDLRFAGETNTSYDTSGHLLVQLWGNFEEQDPTAAQLESASHLVAWLCREHGIDASTISGHCDHAETACPGARFYRLLKDGSFLRRVRAYGG